MKIDTTLCIVVVCILLNVGAYYFDLFKNDKWHREADDE